MESRSMLKKTAYILAALLSALLFIVPAVSKPVFASGLEYISEENSNKALIKDDADLLTSDEESRLLERMKEILPYGNVAFVSNTERNYDAADLAREKYLELLGETSGTLFLIDMHNRRIQIFSGEEVYRDIPEVRANEITDNIYTYATRGDYYTCADKAFEQMRIILEGGAIITPMKYATNAAFAVGIVFLVNFLIVYFQRRKSKSTLALTSATETKDGKGGLVKNINSVMTKQTKTRHAESSGGGGFIGGGGGGGGFSGGGGGGFSGGGGGHGF